MGVAALLQNYSVRGLAVVGALNISQIISNLFNVGINRNGQRNLHNIRQETRCRRDGRSKGIFSQADIFHRNHLYMYLDPLIVTCTFFPMIYNTTDEIKELATSFIRVAAACMPIYAFETCCYFTIRSGGKTLITFLF